jgi:ElaB/YqjD/DUF883 family membrane-anchored ribosome-binding protein
MELTMNEEDEAFNEIERRAKQRMEAVRAAMRVEDDDIQDYKKPWVGLTDDEVNDIVWSLPYEPSQVDIRAIEAKLKEKNT